MVDKIKNHWSSLTVIFTIFAVGGFLMETIGNIVFKGFVEDKGFLTLPLCPIYGIAVILIIIIVGLPFEGKWKNLYDKRQGFSRIALKGLTLLVYTTVCTLVAVLFEFLVGQLFYYVFDMRLWHYQETADTFWNGFISREVSDAWFLLIMICAPLVVTPLYRFTISLNQKPLKIFSIVMISLIIVDLIITLIYFAITGDKINIFNFNI